MKSFLSAGDVLINVRHLSYAVVETDSEGLHLRLGLGDPSVSTSGELRLSGLEARSVLRWLRDNSEFLDSGGSFSRKDHPELSPAGSHIHPSRV
jgi:hypothetical protein